jgi:hypothetical protein
MIVENVSDFEISLKFKCGSSSMCGTESLARGYKERSELDAMDNHPLSLEAVLIRQLHSIDRHYQATRKVRNMNLLADTHDRFHVLHYVPCFCLRWHGNGALDTL